MKWAEALCCTTSVFAIVGLAPAAWAQQASSGEAAEVGEVIVTGSRIVRSGADTPTPVTVTSAEQLQLAAPSTISDALNQLPQFRGSSRPQTGGVSTAGSTGANLLNLRNLGSQRNLVLLDGRRMVPTTNIGVTDINTMPQALVQRVEVVTGGASAAYGSDAVAGVVNFILDRSFEGLKGELQGGISHVGDSDSRKASLTFGRPFADGRGHLVASAEYFYSDDIGPLDHHRRDWSRRSVGIIPNVPGTAVPNRLIFNDDVFVSLGTFGGLITSGPLINTMFGPGGEPQAFVPGRLRGSTFMVGGTPTRHEGNITAGLDRWSLFAHGRYEVSESLELFAEAAVTGSETTWLQYYNFTNAASAFTIFSGNPFIPASIQAQMTAQNIPSFRLGRINAEGPMIGALNRVEMSRAAVGLNGRLGERFTYDAYYSRGQANTRVANTNVMNFNKIYAAVDAVRDPATGNIVCRSTLLFGRHPGCVPFNPFGQGAPSAAAIEYYQDDEWRDLEVVQDVVAANLQGELFSVTSSPVKFALGAEYRRESSEQTADPISQQTVDFTNVRGGPPGFVGQVGPFVVGNFQPLGGEISVREGYVEVDAPLLRDAPLAHSLDVNLAARLTNYSTSGNVTTWKVTGSYAPIRDLRFRATRSRDIRAANVSELFSGGSQSTGTIRDPSGATQNFVGRTVGNPNLDPEEADTLTVGAVYQPSWLPGAEVTVDYYDIKIQGAIASLNAQTTVDECARGSQVACSNINVVSGVYRITLPQLNLSALETNGVDVEVGYRTPAFGGDLSLRALVNYQGKFQTTTPGAPPIDRAGEVGQSSNPEWIAAFNVNYTRGPLTLFLQHRYIAEGVYNVTFTEGLHIDDNSIPGVSYTDVTGRYRTEVAGANLELFVTINNLFNVDPPLAPQQSASLQRYSNFTLYDPIGRYYTAGLRFRF